MTHCFVLAGLFAAKEHLGVLCMGPFLNAGLKSQVYFPGAQFEN